MIERESEFIKLVNLAKKSINHRHVSHFIEAGKVASAILTSKGNVYIGTAINTKCSQGACAERVAAFNMITNGESEIKKIICVDHMGIIRVTCGSCREFLIQLGPYSRDIEILKSMNPFKTVRLSELLKDWWGQGAYSK